MASIRNQSRKENLGIVVLTWNIVKNMVGGYYLQKTEGTLIPAGERHFSITAEKDLPRLKSGDRIRHG